MRHSKAHFFGRLDPVFWEQLIAIILSHGTIAIGCLATPRLWHEPIWPGDERCAPICRLVPWAVGLPREVHHRRWAAHRSAHLTSPTTHLCHQPLETRYREDRSTQNRHIVLRTMTITKRGSLQMIGWIAKVYPMEWRCSILCAISF